MTSQKCNRRGRLKASAAAVMIVTAALGLQGCGGVQPSNALPPTSSPTSTASASATPPALDSASPSTTATPSAKVSPSAAATPKPKPTLAVMAASKPTSLSIDSIGVQSNLVELGQRPNGSLEVPTEGPGSPAGWYTGSPTPGERGPSVMLGHVNATGGGPGVFARLRDLKPGDAISVARADGSTAVFSVERGVDYQKDSFPTLEVYGNTAGSELRLITCDGYQPSTGTWDENYVVYAKLKV